MFSSEILIAFNLIGLSFKHLSLSAWNAGFSHENVLVFFWFFLVELNELLGKILLVHYKATFFKINLSLFNCLCHYEALMLYMFFFSKMKCLNLFHCVFCLYVLQYIPVFAPLWVKSCKYFVQIVQICQITMHKLLKITWLKVKKYVSQSLLTIRHW